jgi:hypothetical protein
MLTNRCPDASRGPQVQPYIRHYIQDRQDIASRRTAVVAELLWYPLFCTIAVLLKFVVIPEDKYITVLVLMYNAISKSPL